MDVREKLVELLTDNLPRIGNLPKCDNPLQYTMDEIVERIVDHLLTNGLVVREKGEWEKYIPMFGVGDFIKCSVCGKSRVNNLVERTNFCPNCGSDMRGEQ